MRLVIVTPQAERLEVVEPAPTTAFDDGNDVIHVPQRGVCRSPPESAHDGLDIWRRVSETLDFPPVDHLPVSESEPSLLGDVAGRVYGPHQGAGERDGIGSAFRADSLVAVEDGATGMGPARPHQVLIDAFLPAPRPPRRLDLPLAVPAVAGRCGEVGRIGVAGHSECVTNAVSSACQSFTCPSLRGLGRRYASTP